MFSCSVLLLVNYTKVPGTRLLEFLIDCALIYISLKFSNYEIALSGLFPLFSHGTGTSNN